MTALRDPTVAKRRMLFSVELSPTSPRLSADAYCCIFDDPIWAQLMHATATGTLHTKGDIRYSTVNQSLGFSLNAEKILLTCSEHISPVQTFCWEYGNIKEEWISSDRALASETRFDVPEKYMAFIGPVGSPVPVSGDIGSTSTCKDIDWHILWQNQTIVSQAFLARRYLYILCLEYSRDHRKLDQRLTNKILGVSLQCEHKEFKQLSLRLSFKNITGFMVFCNKAHNDDDDDDHDDDDDWWWQFLIATWRWLAALVLEWRLDGSHNHPC